MDFTPVWISLKTAFAATLVTALLGVLVARGMLRERRAWKGRWTMRLRGVVDGVLMLPLVLPPSVVGFLLLLSFGASSPVGRLIQHLGVTVVFSWPATVIAATVVAFPLMYKTTLGAFEQIDDNLIEAARTLGASEFRILASIMLPLAWPGVLAGLSLSFARALGEFGATLMLAGNIPGRTQTLPVAVFFAVESGQFGAAILWSLVVISISLVVVAGLHYWSYQRSAPATVLRQAVPDWPPQEKISGDSHSQARGQMAVQQPVNRGSNRSFRLLADIEHRLPGFELKTKFTAEGPLAIVGASGSGKTMTLRSIAGLETPARGRIELNGRVLYDSESGINLPSRRRKIGLLFQNYALFPHLTVAGNVGFGLHPKTKTKRTTRVASILARVHLAGMEGRYPHELSGGQQQRVALARALAIEPEAILLDEPLSALDTYLRSQMEVQLIDALADRPGVMLYVTHNLEEAYRIADDLLVLDHGRQAAWGAKEEIFRRPPTFGVARVTGCKNLSRARTAADGFVAALDWSSKLRVSQVVPSGLAYVGIRAHHMVFREIALPGADGSGAGEDDNILPCWLARAVETPFRVTLFLQLREPAAGRTDYHLEAELFKDHWVKLRDLPAPWHVQLLPDRLFLTSE